MRILIDGYWVRNGPPSGRAVLLEIIRTWSEIFPDDDLFVATRPLKSGEKEILPPTVNVIVTRLPTHPLINLIELPFIRQRIGDVDAIFCQNFSAVGSKSFVYIHDVLFQSNPEWFTRLECVYFNLITVLAKFATTVLTSSVNESIRIKSYNRGLRRVVPTGLGISKSYLIDAPTRKVDALRSDSFFLAVGRLNVRKNLEATISAALASGTISTDFPLVIVGEKSGRNSEWSREIDRAVDRKSVVFLGFVSDEELHWLYRNCKAMVFLALDEGFGLPPIEAASCGAHVIASDIAVMRENLGAFAQYVNPLSKQAIERALREARERVGPTDTNDGRLLPPRWESVVARIRSTMIPTTEPRKARTR